MAKRFSPEFKQQAIDYALSNPHEPIAAIAQKLGVGYSTLLVIQHWINGFVKPIQWVQANANFHQNNSGF